MARASRTERKMRRLKNERRIAYKVASAALNERNAMRNALGDLLKAAKAKQDATVAAPAQETM